MNQAESFEYIYVFSQNFFQKIQHRTPSELHQYQDVVQAISVGDAVVETLKL